MKLATSSEALKRACTAVQALLTEHQVILRADAGIGALIIEAGQSGVYLRQKIPANVVEGGEVVINSTYISATQLSDKVELETTKKGDSISFTSGSMTGNWVTHQATQKIADQRPLEDIEIQVQLSKDIVTKAINRTHFNTPLVQTQEGLRVKLDDHITVSITDSFRASLFKEKLPFCKATMDFQIKPNVLSAAVSKIDDQEVWFGLHKGIIKVASPSFEFYHSTLQSDPTDVEGWLSQIDRSEFVGEITTNVQDLIKTMNAVTSIAGNSNDVKLTCTVNGSMMFVETGAAHGSAKASITLAESSCNSYKTVLHSKYTTDMLALMKEGVVRIGLHNDYIILMSGDGKCTSVVPTAASN